MEQVERRLLAILKQQDMRIQNDNPKLPIVAHLKYGAEAYRSATRRRTSN
jgi:hypothetical protein